MTSRKETYCDVYTSYIAACIGVSKERLNTRSSCSVLVLYTHTDVGSVHNSTSNPSICNACTVNMHVLILCMCVCVCIGVGGVVACDSECECEYT